MKTACAVQCPQCPFRHDALPGWLGSYTAETIISSLWRGIAFFCHTKINYEDPKWHERAEANGKVCLGSLAFSKKLCAPLREDAYPETDARVIALRRENQDRTDIDCMDPRTFQAYHDPINRAANMAAKIASMKPSKKPTKPAMRKLAARLSKVAKKPAKPDAVEVIQEIARLKLVRAKVKTTTAFGDDNHAAIDAQIAVLIDDMHNDEIYDRWSPLERQEDEEQWERDELNRDDGRSDYTLDSALDAYRWRIGEKAEAPSGEWNPAI